MKWFQKLSLLMRFDWQHASLRPKIKKPSKSFLKENRVDYGSKKNFYYLYRT